MKVLYIVSGDVGNSGVIISLIGILLNQVDH